MEHRSNMTVLQNWRDELEAVQARQGVARSIEQCLRYLEEEANENGLVFLAHVIGCAVMAAEDDAQSMELLVPPGPPN